MRKIVPVLLSGGAGTRLWPLSRDSYPKQLLPLSGEASLLQQSALRVADPKVFAPILVVANAEHRFIIAEQLRGISARVSHIALEPLSRNTAAAAAIAALLAIADDPEAILLLMPADHVIADPDHFLRTVQAGAAAAASGAIVLFGIAPDTPATGYGYIKTGAALSNEVVSVERFVEKPTRERAETFIAEGNHYWNSGIFLLGAATLIGELQKFQPDLLDAVRRALGLARHDLDFLRLDAATFADATSISIDYAVMERTDKAVLVPTTMSWSDVGAWSALWDIGSKSPDQNVVVGDVLTHDASGCYLRADGPTVAAIGVRDLIVVSTDDAVLVSSKQRDQDVKAVVEKLKANGRSVATQSRRDHRPWGYIERLQGGDRFQVRLLVDSPGGNLSLQKHFHRAEHWVVVSGTALVTRGDEQVLLGENQSTFLPLGCVHRLENPGRVPLKIVEVQSGAYLAEDDIVRLEDAYARAGPQ